MILLKKLPSQLPRKKNLLKNNNKVNLKLLSKAYLSMLSMAILEIYLANVETSSTLKWSWDQMVNQKVLPSLSFQLNQPLTRLLNLTVQTIWVEILELNKLEEIKDNKDQDKVEIIEANSLLEMPTLKPLLFSLVVFLITQQSNQLNNYSLVLAKFNLLESSLIDNPEK